MKWISLTEFSGLLERVPDDLVVLDLRYDARQVPFPIAEAFVVPVSPNELLEILFWLPSNRSVVFCGADPLSMVSIEMSPSMAGSAPFYFLVNGISRLES